MTDLNSKVLVKKYGEDNLINRTRIDLSRSQIRNIDYNTFKGLTNLEELDLDNNEIEEIDVRSFETLSNLKQLRLYNNKLKRIDFNTFKSLIKLEILWLQNNEIEEIDVRLFESLSNVKKLGLHNNKLKSIDSNTFKGLTKLETLDLGNNEIEEIDFRLFENLSNVKNLTKLEKLWLNNNEIEEIDVRLFESLSNLKAVYLNNNKLKEIDRKCFEPLKSMEVIELDENADLKKVSFIKPSTECYYDKDKVKKYGSISKWNKFLQQFPRLESNEKEDWLSWLIVKTGLFGHKIGSNQEQENPKRNSSSISSNQSTTNRELQELYIGTLLNDRYKVERKLGKGAFGLVYLVDDTKIDDIKNVKEKAMKIMDQSDSTTVNELKLFSEINHENIVRYFDHFHKMIGGENKTFLITEYCENGDLRTKIEEAKRLDKIFTDRQLLDWMTQSTNALKYLHSKKPDPIIHRDIKPENMLLNGRNEIKLGDLGISKIMEETHAITHAGTQIYMSPEVFKTLFMDINYYPNTDIWSLGCVLYELKFLTKAFPRGQKNDPPIPTNVSTSGLFSSVLPKMLERDCLVRITSRQLLYELENLYDN